MSWWLLGLLACGGRPWVQDEDTGTILSVGTTSDPTDCDRTCPLPPNDACGALSCYLYEECCISGPPSEEACGAGTFAACKAQCGIEADCRVFHEPEDPYDPDYVDAIDDYYRCLGRC